MFYRRSLTHIFNKRLFIALIVAVCFSTDAGIFLHAQSPQQTSRADEIRQEREEKQKSLRPEEQSRGEQIFDKTEDIAEKFTSSASGVRMKLSSDAPHWGGLVSGSGFSLGGEYYRPDLAGGEVTIRTSAVGTTKKNYLLDAQLILPRLAANRMFFDTIGRYKAERSIEYYGSGSDSRREDRTNYTRETGEAGINLGFRSARHSEIGVDASSLWLNVGPGIKPGIASSEDVFDTSTAPGIQEQTKFWRGGAYAAFDTRTRPYMPGHGTQVSVRYDRYNDRELSTYSFGLLQAEVNHSITFFNEKRAIVLGALTALSDTASGNVVPFYLQQTLGGPDDLRGFNLFRFTGNNKLVMNGEYRWEVAPPLEMAVFADAGKVFDRRGELNFSDLEASGGFGVRIKTRSAIAVRLDTAFSREGFHIWFRFSDVF
jgi:outer membrane protein assembly factor BamA